MSPYAVLGLPDSASTEQAKAAYRKLAQKYHPDRDTGNEARFKDVKAAWEEIEKGWSPPPPEQTYTSSFTDPSQPKRRPANEKPKPATAGKPAPGYEARNRPPPMPRARPIGNSRYSTSEYIVDLTCTTKQAFEGCTIPFACGQTLQVYEVRPGEPLMRPTHTVKQTFARDDMIGARPGDLLTVTINLTISDEPYVEPKKEVPPKHHDITIRLCGLGLFTGGTVTIADYLNVPVSVVIPTGYDPSKPIIVPNRGYGTAVRGDMRVTVQPIFKAPSALNQGERQQLARLNEMVK